jgi:SWI/SNF-related matrix-associated actin-dependent regulator of chromatin subfamily A-like protein 1
MGKSFQSLLIAQRHPELRPIICICPATVKWHWEEQAKIHINMRSDILEGTDPNTRRTGSPAPLTIVNYDILWPWMDYLESLEAKLLIGDEIHYVINPSTKRSKAFLYLCKQIPHVIGLGGTPLINCPYELWHPLHCVRPDLFPSRYIWGHKWCAPKRRPWGWEFKGSTNPNTLNQLLRSNVMVRRLKEDVLHQLPKKQRMVVPLDIEKRSEYVKAQKDFLGWLKETQGNEVARRASKAETVVQLGYLKRLAAKLKMKFVMEWIEDFLAESDGKLIVFAIHKNIIAALHDKWKKNSVVLTGNVIGRKRHLAIKQFLQNKKTRILFGNIKAAGVGWSAKGVSAVAFVEIGWTPAEHSQAEDRIVGIGRGEEGVRGQVWYLVARETLEVKLLEIIQKKQKTSNAVLDGDDNKGDTMDVYDLLCQELKKENVA